jgi:hypothetical protein
LYCHASLPLLNPQRAGISEDVNFGAKTYERSMTIAFDPLFLAKMAGALGSMLLPGGGRSTLANVHCGNGNGPMSSCKRVSCRIFQRGYNVPELLTELVIVAAVNTCIYAQMLSRQLGI